MWPGRVSTLEHLGARGRVRVRIVGPLTIVAEVTPGAVHDLALVEGTEVWAAVKATEVEVFAV